MNKSVRCLTIAIAICSWFAISNHCAFAALTARGTSCQHASHHRQDADATCCPFHSKPAKPQKPPAGIQCCKILRALVPTVAKSWVRDGTKFSDVDLRFEEFSLIAVSSKMATPLLLDTGPPDARTFAELILQRSLLAHAPPSRV
jgi:hypothetical protein